MLGEWNAKVALETAPRNYVMETRIIVTAASSEKLQPGPNGPRSVSGRDLTLAVIRGSGRCEVPAHDESFFHLATQIFSGTNVVEVIGRFDNGTGHLCF